MKFKADFTLTFDGTDNVDPVKVADGMAKFLHNIEHEGEALSYGDGGPFKVAVTDVRRELVIVQDS